MKEKNNGVEDSATHFARYRFCFSEIFHSYYDICDSHISSIWPTKLMISLVIEDKSGVEVRKTGRDHYLTINLHIPLCTTH